MCEWCDEHVRVTFIALAFKHAHNDMLVKPQTYPQIISKRDIGMHNSSNSNYYNYLIREYNYMCMCSYNYTARVDSISQEILYVWWSLDHPNNVDAHHHSSISLPDCDLLSARSGT